MICLAKGRRNRAVSKIARLMDKCVSCDRIGKKGSLFAGIANAKCF